MTSAKPIPKAVFPVAGLGTRFLPATKANPKEMFPIVDRPLIQYAVDEAREAGIEQMVFVTGRGKGAGGEIQLTDAVAQMIGQQPFHAVTFDGQRFDCGSKLGYVEATLAVALEREDMGADVRAMAAQLLGC